MSSRAVPRWATPRNLERPTLGPRAAAIAEGLGLPFMPWQQMVADVALEVDPSTGLLWHREVVITVPRQSGKTTLLKAVQTHRCAAWARQVVTYTAQTRNAARKKWEDDFVVDLEASALRRLFNTRRANGQEAMLWRNGSRWGIEATTESSGHGDTLDLGVIDEAFRQVDFRLEQAMKPAMMTRPQAQLWVVSTAGTGSSVYLWSKVETGRQLVDLGKDSRVAYFEWSAGDDEDPGDPETWWRCMPALGITVPLEVVQADFDSMALGEFERAYLNRWSATRREAVLPTDDWARLEQLDAQPDMDRIAYAVDVTPERHRASIAVSDGTLLEVIENKAGTEWVVPRVAELVDRHGLRAVVVDPAGPAASLAPELQALDVQVLEPTGREYAAACGQLYDAVVAGEVLHLGQDELEAARLAATRRRRGDVWTWARNDTTVDLSPLIAVTLARWGALHQPPPKKQKPVFAW